MNAIFPLFVVWPLATGTLLFLLRKRSALQESLSMLALLVNLILAVALLSATADGISDPNGTTKAQNGEPGYAWTWQWVRVDGGNKTDIPGATSETYTLVAEDEGKRVKVKVEFTDDADNAEGPLTSAAYPSIGTILPFGSERQVLARVRFAGAGPAPVRRACRRAAGDAFTCFWIRPWAGR